MSWHSSQVHFVVCREKKRRLPTLILKETIVAYTILQTYIKLMGIATRARIHLNCA
jgi:hypothetical protein